MLLDLGCGTNKQPQFIGIDKRKLPGVDIVHDLEDFPWPLEDESCLTVVGSNIIEHIKPWLTIDFFNECWRILKPDCQLVLSTPFGGSPNYYHDPTHCNPFTDKTFLYFDPLIAPEMWELYQPKPWRLSPGFPVYQLNGMLEVIMTKIATYEETAKLADKAITLGAIQKKGELVSLFDYMKDRPLKVIIEIGTCTGGTLFALCQLADKNAHIISIDMPTDGYEDYDYGSKALKRMQTYARNGQQIIFLRTDSHLTSTKAAVCEALKKDKVDLLFIDGDHSYEGVQRDFQMYSPLVKKGGLVVFHDIRFHPNHPDVHVDRFWNEIRDNYKTREFIDRINLEWGGIGVIEWNG